MSCLSKIVYRENYLLLAVIKTSNITLPSTSFLPINITDCILDPLRPHPDEHGCVACGATYLCSLWHVVPHSSVLPTAREQC